MSKQKVEKNYAIKMINITKKFGNFIANNKINFNVEKGSIHALIGENGAGKSTLMSMLFGLNEPTSGKIKLYDREVLIKNPNDATELNIGMVHQHFKLVDIYNALDNIILGSEKVHGWQLLNKPRAKKKIISIQKKYKLDFKLNSRIENTSVGEQQKIEITKMLYRNSEILIFDEPTAVLTPKEVDGLLSAMKHFKKLGKTIIFITHKLHEVMEVADRATVIRRGEDIGTVEIKDTSVKKLSEMMVGKAIVQTKNNIKNKFEEDVLFLDNISTKKINHKKLSDITFKIKKGEIVAIAGVEGNGQTEIANVISGIMKPNKGKIFMNNKNITNFNVRKRYGQIIDVKKTNKNSEKNKESQLFSNGIAHVHEDRHKYTAVLNFSVANNMVLQEIKRKKFNKYGILKTKQINDYTKKIIKDFDVRGANEGKSIFRGLSGGNQQKAIVGREMEREHDLLIVSQPTRGLDIGAIQYIHKRILEEKQKGKAILLISYELDEVLALADKIIVMAEGKISGIRDAKKVSKPELGLLMAGGEN